MIYNTIKQIQNEEDNKKDQVNHKKDWRVVATRARAIGSWKAAETVVVRGGS